MLLGLMFSRIIMSSSSGSIIGRWWHYNPSKCQELSAQWHSITSQKTWVMKISVTDCNAILLSALTVSLHHACPNTNLNCCCPDALLLAAVIWFAICWFRSRFRCNLSCNSEIRLSMLLISSWRCDSASLCWQRRAFCCSFSLLRYCNQRQQHEFTRFLTIL
jgi:hypothetical protein